MTDWEHHAQGYARECHDAERVLAEALGMGVYPPDGPSTPGDRAIGDHTTTSLAMAAADEIERLRFHLISARAENDRHQAERPWAEALHELASRWTANAEQCTGLAVARDKRGDLNAGHHHRGQADGLNTAAQDLRGLIKYRDPRADARDGRQA